MSDSGGAPGPQMPEATGAALHALVAELYPICRSITGDGVRRSLAILARHLPLVVHEVPTGTQVFDWTIPREWRIRDAFIEAADGRRVLSLADSTLHVVSYSAPVDATMPLHALRQHIHTLPGQPDLIPYRTSYYEERWGFCMAHNALAALPEGPYRARIDAEFLDGALTYGEWFHAGEQEEEVLLSAHACHPSLANDNCSGMAVLALLAARMAGRRTRYSYRFLFAPGTIGAIAWLARNSAQTHRIRHGLVVAGVGDPGAATYKRSRRGDAPIDAVMAHVLRHADAQARLRDFSPYGYDERQFCSPGFDLPVGLLQRSPFGEFPEYHTSADNLDFVQPGQLAASLALIETAIEVLEKDRRLRNTLPFCEPQLGRRGLYGSVGGDANAARRNLAMLWVLNQSDGSRSLFEIAERAALPFATIAAAAESLERAQLLEPA
jgi:aminopeptidase-like protein